MYVLYDHINGGLVSDIIRDTSGGISAILAGGTKTVRSRRNGRGGSAVFFKEKDHAAAVFQNKVVALSVSDECDAFCGFKNKYQVREMFINGWDCSVSSLRNENAGPHKGAPDGYVIIDETAAAFVCGLHPSCDGFPSDVLCESKKLLMFSCLEEAEHKKAICEAVSGGGSSFRIVPYNLL